jgi:hypothetical protein
MAKQSRKMSEKQGEALINKDIALAEMTPMAAALAQAGVGTSGTAIEVAIKKNVLEPELVAVKEYMDLFLGDIAVKVTELHTSAQEDLAQMAMHTKVISDWNKLMRRIDAANEMFRQGTKSLIDMLERDRKAAQTGEVWLTFQRSEEISNTLAYLRSPKAFAAAIPDLLKEMNDMKPAHEAALAYMVQNEQRKEARKMAQAPKEVMPNKPIDTTNAH